MSITMDARVLQCCVLIVMTITGVNCISQLQHQSRQKTNKPGFTTEAASKYVDILSVAVFHNAKLVHVGESRAPNLWRVY